MDSTNSMIHSMVGVHKLDGFLRGDLINEIEKAKRKIVSRDFKMSKGKAVNLLKNMKRSLQKFVIGNEGNPSSESEEGMNKGDFLFGKFDVDWIEVDV